MFSGGSKGDGGMGLGGLCPPPPPPSLFRFCFYKSEVYYQKLVLNKYEICLKMLEKAILETRLFKKFSGGGCPHTSLESSHLRHSLVPPPPLENLGSTPDVCLLVLSEQTLMVTPYYLNYPRPAPI